MAGVSVVLEEFVDGDLDFAGLERELASQFAGGDSRADALDALKKLGREKDLSPALAALMRRAIDRHFAMDDTDPFPEIRPSRPARRQPDLEEYEDTDPDLPLIYPQDTGEQEPAPEAKPKPKAKPKAKKRSRGKTESASEGSKESAPEPVPAPEASDVPEAPALPEPGDVIAGRYEIERLLGRGGAGLVYRAVDHCRLEAGADDPRVAIKMLKPDLAQNEDAQRRLLAEGVRGSDLRHENLVRVIDVGHDEGRCFLTMELLEGDSLRSAILRHSPDGYPADEALEILAGIARGLSFLHGRGLVHGDLKPGNVFLTRDGQPKLLDFGTSAPGRHGQEPTLVAAAPPGRTPAYASPEALGGDKLTFSDDVFSLGCVACELLSAKHPFGRMQADEARDERLKPALPRSVSGSRRRALAAALRFDGQRRPADARAFIKEMGLERKRGNRAGLALAALGGLAAGILLVLGIISPGGPLGRIVPLDVGEVAVQSRSESLPSPDLERSSGTGAGTPAPAAVDSSGRFAPPDASGDEEEPQPPAGSVPETAGAVPESMETGLGPARPATADTDTPARATETAETTPGAPEPAAAVPQGPGTVSFAQNAYQVTEGTAVLIATIARQGGTSGDVTVRWRTVSGTAEADADFVGTDWEEAIIPNGLDAVRIYVPLVDDGLIENDESFFLELARPGGGAELGSPARVRVQITDDE